MGRVLLWGAEVNTATRGRGRPPGVNPRASRETLCNVWAEVESIRRTVPAKAHVDDACDAYALRGVIEWNPAVKTAWVSNTSWVSSALRARRTGVRIKTSDTPGESFRKLYDAANKLRVRDADFRAISDSLLLNNLRVHDKREELAGDLTADQALVLMELTPEVRANLIGRYPPPKKFRIRRRATG